MTISETILNYWPIIVYFIGGIVSLAIVWVKLTYKVVALKEELNDVKNIVAKFEGRIDAMSPLMVTLQTDMASVKTSLEFIKGSINQMSSKNSPIV